MPGSLAGFRSSRRLALIGGLSAAAFAARAQEPLRTYPLASSSLILDVAQAGAALLAVGDRGFILRSTDGGATWTQVASPAEVMLTGLAMASPDVGIAVGHDATILRTGDGGLSWSLVASSPDLESPLLAAWFDRPEHGLAVGAYGLLMETADGGQTWAERRISDDEPHLYAAARLRDGSVLVAGETGAMFKSANQGATWTPVASSPYGGTYFGLLALADGAVLAYGLRGNLFRSADQGSTWTEIALESTASLMGATQRRTGGVYIVGLAGTILTSIDGVSFQVTTLTSREALSGVMETAGGDIVICGEKGVRRLDPKAGA